MSIKKLLCVTLTDTKILGGIVTKYFALFLSLLLLDIWICAVVVNLVSLFKLMIILKSEVNGAFVADWIFGIWGNL